MSGGFFEGFHPSGSAYNDDAMQLAMHKEWFALLNNMFTLVIITILIVLLVIFSAAFVFWTRPERKRRAKVIADLKEMCNNALGK